MFLNIIVRNNFKQGIYKPINKEKYIGKGFPEYRSGWELKFFRWADKNENVIKWGSENIVIPYVSPLDNRVHRYFVDNYILFKDRNDNINKFLIEIKPSSQTVKPVNKKYKRKSSLLYEQKTYIQNIAKWEAAKKWSDKKGVKFLILTEKELNIKRK